MGTAIVLAGVPDLQAAFDRVWEVASPGFREGDAVTVWLPDSRAEQAALSVPSGMVEQVICSDGGEMLLEHQLLWLGERYREQCPKLLLFYGSITGHELAVRMSARLECQCFPEVYSIEVREQTIRVRRKTCGSHLDWTVELQPAPFVATIARGRAANKIAGQTVRQPVIKPPIAARTPDWMVAKEALELLAANPLESAARLLVGGRGLGSRDACTRLREVAQRWGMTPGYSRPVAMNGWCGLHEIVGQSGCRTAPELCIALGVSGAAAFMAGVSGAKTLIAVNTDAHAPIFQYANVGIVTDAVEFMDALGQI